MAKYTKQVKNLSSTFSGGSTLESDVQSTFVRGLDSGSKRRRMIAGKAPQEGLPSSASIFSELTGLPMDGVASTTIEAEGMRSAKTLPDSNIGYKLLKKSGWKEGSGLGISEQGRLNPLEPQFKSDRRGIGAKKDRKYKTFGEAEKEPPTQEGPKIPKKATRKEKNLSKKAKKIQSEEKKMQEQVFEQQFYREFWPENV